MTSVFLKQHQIHVASRASDPRATLCKVWGPLHHPTPRVINLK